MAILVAILAAYGITFGLQNGKAPWLTSHMRKVRALQRMLTCSYCTGFHAGWATWLIALSLGDKPLVGDTTFFGGLAGLILWCFASAISCSMLDAVHRWLTAEVIGEE